MKPSNQIFLLVATVAPSFGFHVAPQKTRVPTLVHESTEMDFLSTGEPFHNTDIDIKRSKECAAQFGKCSTGEIRKLRDDLHRERIQHSLLGDMGIAAPEETFEHHLLEEELNLQLNLLSDQMPEAHLFPEEDVAELPHLKDGPTESAKHDVTKGYEEFVKHEKEVHMFEELAEEGVVESLAFCGILALAIMAPQVLFN